MDPWELIALVLWISLGVLLIALIAGIITARGSHRTAALVLLLIADAGTLTFSLISGFSIGRFTAVVPVLVSGFVIGMGRSRLTAGACLLVAAVIYLLFSWLLTPLGFDGGLPALLFGFWAIPVYAVIAVFAFGSSFATRPMRTDTF